MTPEERFWSKVDKTGSCWLWTRALDRDGYGRFLLKQGDTRFAHRLAYEWEVGPIPEGAYIDHVLAKGCTSRACVNPAHLEPVTPEENLRRAPTHRGQWTSCPHGHEFTLENTKIDQKTGKRSCRACNNRRSREFLARKKQKSKK